MTKQQTNTLKKLLIPMLALLVILLMVAWLAGMFNNKVSPTMNINKPHLNVTEQKNSYTVIASKNVIFEPVAASLAAKQATIISARILARIEQIKTRSGNLVKKGDLLVQLESSDLESRVLQAKENVKALQARLKEAKQNFTRAEELFKTSLVSKFEFDKNHTNYQTIQAELTAANQALSQAQTALSYASLKAPIDGRIVDRFAEPGDTVQPGTRILSLYNPLSLRVEAQIREQLALTLTKEQKIEIELPSLNKTISGEIEEIVPAANTGSRSFLVKVRMPHHDKILPGMYARMLIPAGKQTQLTIPVNKVAHVGQLDFVWLKIDGQIQRRLVRLGKEKNGMVTVISGLMAGDKIIEP